MKFPYKKYSTQILRPVIPITLKNGSESIRYEVLVDSGADICLFDAEIGELLGLEVLTGEKSTVGGVAGQTSEFYIHPIELEIGGLSFFIKAGFLPDVTQGFRYGVVGQQGFFDHFVVSFDLAREEIDLQPNVWESGLHRWMGK
jgi:hypothetical protein